MKSTIKNLKKLFSLYVITALIFGGGFFVDVDNASAVTAVTITDGPNNGSNFSDDSSIGSYIWSNPSRAQTSNNSYATATLASSGTATHYLKATGFGFSIPSGTSISGIKVDIERKQACFWFGCTSDVIDNTVRLVKAGTVVGTNKASVTHWPIFDTVASYGTGMTDLWGTTWTRDEINSSNFGVVLSAQRSIGGDRNLSVDHISITVYYIDIESPVIAAHGDVTAEATSASGATVNFTNPTATDNVDSSVDVICDPSSGSTFSIGTTTVTCNAEDASHNSTTPTTFDVIVQDTTGPIISDTPSDVSVKATGPSGTIVEYTDPTANDAVDGETAVSCSPVSGSTFPVGLTTVTCSSSDSRENTSTSNFNVYVGMAFIITPSSGNYGETTNITVTGYGKDFNLDTTVMTSDCTEAVIDVIALASTTEMTVSIYVPNTADCEKIINLIIDEGNEDEVTETDIFTLDNTTLHVCQDVGELACSYSDINSALSEVADGDTILVGPGEYEENALVINHQISLRSTDGSGSTFFYPSSESENGVTINHSNVAIEGFTFDNSAYWSSTNGIYSSGKNNITLEDCDVGYFGTGIDMNLSAGNLINNCVVHNSLLPTTGINLSAVENSTVSNTTVRANEIGISLSDSSNNQFIDNIIGGEYEEDGNTWGGMVLLAASDENTISGGTFGYNNQNNPYNYGGIYIGSSDNNTITGVEMHDNRYAAINLFNSDSTMMDNNNLHDNCGGESGIYVYRSDDTTIKNGDIVNGTGYGIEAYYSNGLNVLDNTITDNSYDGIYFYGDPEEHAVGLVVSGNTVSNTNLDEGRQYYQNYGIRAYYADDVEIEDNIIDKNNSSGAYFYRINGLTITDNTITENQSGDSGLDLYYVTGANVNLNKIYNNYGHGLYNYSGESSGLDYIVDATANWWGDQSGPYHEVLNTETENNSVNENVGFSEWCINEDCTAYDWLNYGTDDFTFMFENEVLRPMFAEESELPTSIIALQGFIMNVFDDSENMSSVKVPFFTAITASSDGLIDYSLLSSSNIDASALSGLGDELAGNGLQWGIPEFGLTFDQPITVNLFVGTEDNGKTLDVHRSLSATSGWTTEGLEDTTCVVSEGVCSFQTNNASYFAATISPETPGSGGSSGSLPPQVFSPPSGGSSLKVVINNGAEITNNEIVNLYLYGGPDAKTMAVSEDSNFVGTSLIPYVTNMKYKLSSGNEIKTVYAKFFTAWGQSSAIVSDSIKLDYSAVGVPTGQVLGVKFYPDGSLLRSKITKRIYFIINGKKLYISSLRELWKYRNITIINVDEDVLAQYMDIYPDGSLLRSKMNKRIYLIVDGKKLYISLLKELWKYRNIIIINVDEDILEQYLDVK